MGTSEAHRDIRRATAGAAGGDRGGGGGEGEGKRQQEWQKRASIKEQCIYANRLNTKTLATRTTSLPPAPAPAPAPLHDGADWTGTLVPRHGKLKLLVLDLPPLAFLGDTLLAEYPSQVLQQGTGFYPGRLSTML